MSLSEKHCIPCKGGTPPLLAEQEASLLKQISDWSINEHRRLEKKFSFPDFKSALHFVNRVGEVSEAEGHHPEIVLGWGLVKISLWTHAINGLTESDFILAAKIDTLKK